jgi:hypothetical protein
MLPKPEPCPVAVITLPSTVDESREQFTVSLEVIAETTGPALVRRANDGYQSLGQQQQQADWTTR